MTTALALTRPQKAAAILVAMGKPAARADLHFSRSRDGELFLTSRQDGMIRMLVPDSGVASASAN